MKISRLSLFIIFIALSFSLHAWSQTDQVSENIAAKQTRAVQLINVVGTIANDPSLKNNEAAQYAYNGFIARFQGIQEDREASARKEAMADDKTLPSYSQRFDQLIADIYKFLK